MSRKRLFIGTVESLFESDSESDESDQSKKIKNSGEELLDEHDELLNASYDACVSELNNLLKKIDENILEDGNDDLLNSTYESAKDQFEPRRNEIPPNLQYLMQNTPKEIKRNRLIAKVRLVETTTRDSHIFKKDLSDYFFSVEIWPNYAIEL